MGVVYKAEDPEIGRLVAIKTLKSMYMGDDAAGEEAMQRFRQESRSAGKLHHPNIVTIFEAGKTENGSPYIVMEFIQGISLEKSVAESGAMDPPAIVHYLSQIASAIDYAHTQNVIHRDLKPSNIVVDSNHKPFLLDFGVAKLADTSLTPAGTVVGTPSYMSPEQIRGTKLDGRTDLFSLAVVAYELFTGVRPFPGSDFTTVVSNIMHKPPLSFAEVGAELPEGLESVLLKGLAKEREERFTSALALIDSTASVFGLAVDGAGLLGGYRPGMSVSFTQPSSQPTLDSGSSSEQQESAGSEKGVAEADSHSQFSPGAGIITWALGTVALAALCAIAYIKLAPVDDLAADGVSDAPIEVVQVPVEDESRATDEGFAIAAADGEVDKLKTPPLDLKSIRTAGQVRSLSDEHLRQFLDAGSPSDKLMRIAIGNAGLRDSLVFQQALLKHLRNKNFAVRVEVLKALRREEYLSKLEVLDEVLKMLGDKEYLVRGFAARLVSGRKEPQVAEALKRQLESENNEVVRKVLVQALE